VPAVPEATRARRSTLAVPGSSPKMLAKAAGLPADEVFLDLEDSVAPGAKAEARANIVRALEEGDWAGKVVVLRINAVDTAWCHLDVIDVVGPAGARLDCVMVPKVQSAHDVTFVANLLRMVEKTAGHERPLGIEAQIESARGLRAIHAIAHASERLETLILGPGDMAASLGAPMTTVGGTAPGYPGDPWHWVRSTILVAARDAGLQAIDGPYGLIRDADGLRASALAAYALGYDGKWAIHPGQIETINEVFTPEQEAYDRAEAILEAYEHSTTVDAQGAVMFGDEMIDAASRQMSERLALRGRAAGLEPQKRWADFR
jgi:citrate lyase subunit beta/citryl-CoA lyase